MSFTSCCFACFGLFCQNARKLNLSTLFTHIFIKHLFNIYSNALNKVRKVRRFQSYIMHITNTSCNVSLNNYSFVELLVITIAKDRL